MKYLFFFISFLFFYNSTFAQDERGLNDSYYLELIPVKKGGGRQYLILKTIKNQILDSIEEVPSSYRLVDYYVASSDTVSYIYKSTEHYFFSKNVEVENGIWKFSKSTWIGNDPIWPIATKELLENPPTYHLRGPDTVIRRSQGREQIIDAEALIKRFQVVTSPKK